MNERERVMTNRAIRRIYRAATPEELEEDRRVRAQIAEELPELRQQGRELLAEALRQGGMHEQLPGFRAWQALTDESSGQVDKSA